MLRGTASAAATDAASLGTGFGGSVGRYVKKIMDEQERGMSSVAAFGTALGPPISSAEGTRTMPCLNFFQRNKFGPLRNYAWQVGGDCRNGN